jgi:hypothetical protein
MMAGGQDSELLPILKAYPLYQAVRCQLRTSNNAQWEMLPEESFDGLSSGDEYGQGTKGNSNSSIQSSSSVAERPPLLYFLSKLHSHTYAYPPRQHSHKLVNDSAQSLKASVHFSNTVEMEGSKL